MSATLFLVGVGPGDPELLTLKAARILNETPIIAYGQKPNTNSFAYEIARTHINKNAKILPFNIPMEIKREPAKKAYYEISKEIKTQLATGKNIAYLCEGDPLFYGSAMYLIERISSDIKIEIISGINSFSASAAAIIRPLAARNEIFKTLPAPLANERLLAELQSTPAVAIIKISHHFERIKKLLEKTGHAKNAYIVEYASTEKQRIIKLSDYSEKSLPYFSTIICYNGDEPWGR